MGLFGLSVFGLVTLRPELLTHCKNLHSDPRDIRLCAGQALAKAKLGLSRRSWLSPCQSEPKYFQCSRMMCFSQVHSDLALDRVYQPSPLHCRKRQASKHVGAGLSMCDQQLDVPAWPRARECGAYDGYIR